MKRKYVPYHREDIAERSGFRKQTRMSVAEEERHDDTRAKRIRDYRSKEEDTESSRRRREETYGARSVEREREREREDDERGRGNPGEGQKSGESEGDLVLHIRHFAD